MLDITQVRVQDTQFYKEVFEKGQEQGLERGLERSPTEIKK